MTDTLTRYNTVRLNPELIDQYKAAILDRYETKMQLLRRIASTRRSHTVTPPAWVWGKTNRDELIKAA